MKHFTFLKPLLVAVCLLVGTNSWADGEISFTAGNRIGATDNSTGWYGQASEIIAVGPHQRLTLKFKTYTATDEQMGGTAWDDQKTHALNIWDGQQQNLYMKGNSWGWKTHGGSVNNPEDYDVNTTGVFNQKTYGWGNDYRTMIGDGADVVMYIERNGSELSISQTFTTSGGDKYYHYFSGTFGLANGNVWLQMTIDKAHIDITADKELTDASLTGILIGKQNNTGGFKGGDNIDFTIGANKALELKFKSYTNKINSYNGWGIEMQYGGDYFDFIPGNKNIWGNLNVSQTTDWGTWPSADNDRKEAMDGANVNLTIARSGGTVTVTAVHVTAANVTHTITHSFTPSAADFATSDVTFRFAVEGGHLDLLSEAATIGSTGWTTFASPCALDLAKFPSGVSAYYAATDAVNGDYVTMTQKSDEAVAAGTGLLLKGTPNETYSIPVAASGTDISSSNLLKGCTSSTALSTDASKYVLVNNGGTAEFQSLKDNGATIPAGKAYLDASGGTLVKALRIVFEDTETGVESIEHSPLTIDHEAGAMFDLSGRRVSKAQKGIFIANGKKVVVK